MGVPHSSTMGISRDSFHKRRKSGGKLTKWRMCRKFELGRQSSNSKIGHEKRIRTVRTRGGNTKYRALRLDTGNFSWATESITRKTRLLNVAYNSTNNELVRTNTLVKSGIIQIDAAPFKQWYEQFYGVEVGKTSSKKEEEKVSQSNHVLRKIKKRQQTKVLAKELENQFNTGRLYAKISSRPGQSGRCDGYILEGAELKFYLSKMSKKK